MCLLVHVTVLAGFCRGENLSIVGDIITVVLITLKSGSHYGAIFKHQLLFYPKSRNSTDLNACKEHQ